MSNSRSKGFRRAADNRAGGIAPAITGGSMMLAGGVSLVFQTLAATPLLVMGACLLAGGLSMTRKQDAQ